MTEGPVEVYVARDAAHARHALAALAAEQVPGKVVGEHLQTAAGDLGMSFNALPRIWVPGEHAARAQEVLAAFDATYGEGAEDEAPSPPWTCAACGEEIDGVYDACWQCQADRPT